MSPAKWKNSKPAPKKQKPFQRKPSKPASKNQRNKALANAAGSENRHSDPPAGGEESHKKHSNILQNVGMFLLAIL